MKIIVYSIILHINIVQIIHQPYHHYAKTDINSLLCLLVLFFFAPAIACQIDTLQQPEKIKEWKAVNRDVWLPFGESFRTGNAEQFVQLYTPDCIHFSGRRKNVEYFTKLSDDIRTGFINRAQRNIPFEVDVRLTERIIDSAFASERGVFKAIIRKGQQNERVIYTIFHLILRKNQGAWKIMIDYDAQETPEVAQSLYERAFQLDEFDKF